LALAALPLTVLHGFAALFAWLAFRVFGYRTAIIRQSLAIAFPESTFVEREQIRRDFYRGYGDVMMELVKSATMPGAELDQRMRFVNLEAMREAIAAGTPVVLLAAHQCNWEWILLGLSRQLGFPVDAAYKPLKNGWADREMLALRSRFGARMIPAERVMRELIARRRVPRLLALVADQEPVASERRHWTHFLNRETAFFMGADVIATSMHYPVFFVTIERTGRGRYLANFECLAKAGEPLESGELTERYARRVERQIRQSPADWPWSHKRWRLRP
jgi:KDO2-lipid IV(A) lauroyltransferase